MERFLYRGLFNKVKHCLLMRTIALPAKMPFLVAVILFLGSYFPASAIADYKDTLLTRSAVGASMMPDTIAPVKAPFPIQQFKKPSFNALSINIGKKGVKPGSLATRAIQSA